MPDGNSIELKQTENFESFYANNVHFEPSAWDVKMIFGQLDQIASPSTIQQHTAITLSWPMAKLTAYYLMVNLIFQQQMDGLISVPKRVVPPKPNSSQPGLELISKAAVAYIAWVHEQLFGEAYVPPEVQAIVEEAANQSTQHPT